MKLFFDPFINQPDANLLDDSVILDMQIENLLSSLIAGRDMEKATFKYIKEFCVDPKIINSRQDFVGDLIYTDKLFEMFSAMRNSVWEMKILYELKMFKEVPEMATMKTFLLVEKFSEVYSEMLSFAEELSSQKLNTYTQNILDAIKADDKKKELKQILDDLGGLRTSLETIGEIRLNRFFSRGQNIENSITTKPDDISLTRLIAQKALAMQLDISEVEIPALMSSKELTRPVFNSLYKLYFDIFKNIDTFHEKYKDFFDTSWFNLIEKLDAALGFAIIFKKLIAKGFPITKAEPSHSTKISGFYSFFLISKDVPKENVIYNDYIYNDKTSFYFITGPNAGGKTIFLSAVGLCQIFFQSCGFIPAHSAKIKIVKRIFTHFPVEEYNDNSGRLVEEQERVENIFRKTVDSETLSLFNETYSSTKADIAYKLSVELCEQVLKRKVAGIFVTHLHSLKDYAAETKEKDVSIGVLTALNDEKTGNRLYKIVPLSTQNSSFSKDILLKYDMTLEQMMTRINSKAKEGKSHVS